MKSNYGPTGESIALRWERGRFVLAGSNLKQTRSHSDIDQTFLELIALFARQNRNVVATPGKSYAPSEFAAHADANGITKESFRHAMDRLLKAGTITNEEYGPPSTRRSKLVLSPSKKIED